MEIMDLSSDAFDFAEKNMDRIIMQASVTFGPRGHVSEHHEDAGALLTRLASTQIDMMLRCLQDSRLAETHLREMTDKLASDIELCAQWAKDTEAHFKKLSMSARELKQAMTDNAGRFRRSFNTIRWLIIVIAKAEDDKEFARLEALTAEVEKRQMERTLEVLKALEEDGASEYGEAKALYNRAAKKGGQFRVTSRSMIRFLLTCV